ncbi:hypothetical protein [Paraburkholderia caledonica]|uniref:hypothetical protein n=1 Tax=Paraburkholderia caledonica TaxID=134536 RepID=UPI001FC7DBE8|nr:hypothetical protein [Paraburkholderia caledonica]
MGNSDGLLDYHASGDSDKVMSIKSKMIGITLLCIAATAYDGGDEPLTLKSTLMQYQMIAGVSRIAE